MSHQAQDLPEEYVEINLLPQGLPEGVGYGLQFKTVGIDCSVRLEVDPELDDLVVVDQSKGLVACAALPFEVVGTEESAEDDSVLVLRIASCEGGAPHIHVTCVAHPRILDRTFVEGPMPRPRGIKVLMLGGGEGNNPLLDALAGILAARG